MCRSSIEAAAAHEAAAIEQKARGQLERQKLHNAMEPERQMCELLQIRSVSAAVESAGQAVAEARARAEKQGIEAHSEIEGASLSWAVRRASLSWTVGGGICAH